MNESCVECGHDLIVNRWKIRTVEVFCGNEECNNFVQAFWTERAGTQIVNGRLRIT